MYRVETVTGSSSGGGVAAAAQLLHDFTVEYDAGVTVLRIALGQPSAQVPHRSFSVRTPHWTCGSSGGAGQPPLWATCCRCRG